MSLLTKKGVFAADTSGGLTQTISGFGFTPKAMIVWTGNNQDWEGANSHQTIMVGVSAASAGAREVYAGWLGNAASMDFTTFDVDSSGIVLGTADGLISYGNLSLGPDGFSITWAQNLSVNALVHYFAIGGSDVLGAATVVNTVSGTGTQTIAGLSFQPDAAIFIGSGNHGASAQGMSIGAALSPSKQWAIAINSLVGSWAKSMQRTDRCLLGIANTGADVEVGFSSFTSDGCNLNIITNPSGFPYAALLLRTNGRVDLGSFAKSTTSADGSGVNSPYDDISPTFTGGAEVAGLLLASNGQPASTSLQSDSTITFGGAAFAGFNPPPDSPDQLAGPTDLGCTWSASKDSSSPSVANAYFASTEALFLADTTTVAVQATASPFLRTDGGIRNFWETNDTRADQVLWLAFGAGNARSLDVAVPLKKPTPQFVAKNYGVNVGVTLKKPVVSIAADKRDAPVIPITGTVAVALKKFDSLLGVFQQTGTNQVAGEGIAGETLAGPPDYTVGTIAVTLKKPTLALQAHTTVEGIDVTLKKPVVGITGLETFSGTTAAVLKKPTAAITASQAVLSGAIAATLKKPVPAVAVGETFAVSAAATLKKPSVSIDGVAGNIRIAVPLKKFTIAITGTAALTHYFGPISVTLKKPTESITLANVPPAHLWPRARQVGAVK
jgi:hypothetical protein